jgi:hypothetical protein
MDWNEGMNQFIKTLALVAGLAAALLTGILGAWKELPIPALILRSGIAAAVVYAFLLLGGDLATRSILRGLAEHQLKNEESRNRRASGESASGERKAA